MPIGMYAFIASRVHVEHVTNSENEQSILAPFTMRQTLKILHIRKSGLDMGGPMIARSDPPTGLGFVGHYRFSRRDFNQFADWVFGRDGLLKVRGVGKSGAEYLAVDEPTIDGIDSQFRNSSAR